MINDIILYSGKFLEALIPAGNPSVPARLQYSGTVQWRYWDPGGWRVLTGLSQLYRNL